MATPRFTVATALILLSFLCGVDTARAGADEFKPSKSDANIHKVGHRNIGKGLDFYSLKKEKELGKQLAEQIDRSAKLVDDPEITWYIDRLAQLIARHSDARMTVTFHVIDSGEAGAFTLPGGYQYIDRGLLLQLKSEAELAGVLAYGIANTALRSATKEATKADIAQIAAIPGSMQGGGPMAHTSGTTEGAKVMIPLTDLKLRLEDKLAADYFGLQYVYVTGYDPECYVSFVQRIRPQVAPASAVFGTSPPLEERVAAMRKEISSILPKRSDAVVSTPAFAEFEKRLRAWKPSQAPNPE